MSETGPMTGPLTPDLEGLKRLERRISRAMSAKAVGRRLWESVPAIAQITVAVLAAYAIAHYGFGHPVPIVAVTVTITSLGFNRDARPVRVLRSVIGILLGIALATALVLLIGQGVWQFAILLVVAFVVARIVSTDPTFAVVAATPAALTFLLPVLDGGQWIRVIDALIGGAVALAITVLIPRDPRRTGLRDARAAYSVLMEGTGSIAEGLREGDAGAAELGANRLRRMPELLESWTQSLETARAIARISPFLRSRLPELERQSRALRGADLGVRHLRLIARRCEHMVRATGAHPELAALVDPIARAIELIGRELTDVELAGSARSVLVDLAHRLDLRSLGAAATPSASAVVLQLRPLTVDLLVATGMPIEEARAELAPL